MLRTLQALICLLMLIAQMAMAAPTVVLQSQQDSLLLGGRLMYVEDAGSRLTLDQVVDASTAWTASPNAVPNFGYTDSTFWFHTRLENPDATEQLRYLEISYPLLDDVQLFLARQNGQAESWQTGDRLPFNSRPLAHRGFVFPISWQAGETVDLYLRVSSQGAVQVPVQLWKPEAFFLQDQNKLMAQSIYYGIMMIMVLYNLFLYFSLREKSYLYYVGFVFSFVTMLAAMHGVLFQHVFPSSPKIHEWVILFFVPSTMLFACLFTRSFLDLSTISPWINRYMAFNVGLSLLCMAGAFFVPYAWSTRISVFLVIPASLMIFISGPYAWKKGQKSARFFTIAWLMLLVGTTLAAMNKFGLIPRNFLTENGLQWGSAIEAALLSFALADRFNREREARYREQRLKLQEAERRERAEQRLIYQATHNAVSGFPNGILLRERMDDMLAIGKNVKPFALVLIHLRRFHEINKTLGYANADQLLRQFSFRLNDILGEVEDSLIVEKQGERQRRVANLEGVSFVALFDCSGGTARLQQQLHQLIHDASEPIAFEAMNIDVGLAVGVALAPEHGDEGATLLRNAQIAVDMAHKHKRLFGIYSPDVNPYNARRLSLMGELRKAIDDNKLQLYFQPQMCFENHRITGLEALVRWNHEVHGFIPPDEFIPIAEKTGLIKPLTAWVIDRALETLKTIPGEDALTVSVNISAVNLREEGFVQAVLQNLQHHGVLPSQLVLEITESAVMGDPEHALQVLNELKSAGIKLSIDDFGTGHSSLSYIKRLPVHEIKIDRSFVMEMDQTTDDRVIVETTLNMCHRLGYKVVAEGIENEAIFNALEHMHCDYAQGYYLARPLPQADLLAWLATTVEKV